MHDNDLDHNEWLNGPEPPESERDDLSCDECDERSVVAITVNGRTYRYCPAHREASLAQWAADVEQAQAQQQARYYGHDKPVTVQEQYDEAAKEKRGWR